LIFQDIRVRARGDEGPIPVPFSALRQDLPSWTHSKMVSG
jgi:hypothetical protein